MKHTSFRLFTLSIILIFSVLSKNLHAQVTDPKVMDQIRSALTAKGLTEEDVKARLKTKGMDIDNMTQEELVLNRGAIEQVVAELEAEKSGGKVKKLVPPGTKAEEVPDTTEPVNESVEELLTDKAQEMLAKELPGTDIYGHKIFRENSIAIYRISKDASPPETYVLGTGDKINILIFGKSQADAQYEINAGGYIQPNLMPKIFLSGLTLKQAKEMLIGKFSTYYTFNSDQFALTLNTSRTLTVNIFGEVERQGSYTTSALNTALNALAVSGGPTDFGSVRNIQIIRGNTKKILDVYAFMRNPIKQFDFYLQNNDIIYVPVAEKIVTLAGGVHRPMRYELKATEGLKELIDYAGGLEITAYTNFVQVQSYENNSMVIKDYNLTEVLSGKQKLALKHGDVISIKSINNPMRSFVKIEGALRYPGVYELKTSKTLKSVLQKAILLPEAKTDQVFIKRRQADRTIEILSISIDSLMGGKSIDFPLQEEDIIYVYDQGKFFEQFSISVIGEVRSPFKENFKYNGRLKIQEAIIMSGGLKSTAATFGYIYRTDPFKPLKTEYLPIELSQVMNDSLMPGDQLIILNKDIYERESLISLGGDVRTPIKLRYDPTLTVKDMILLAGGLTISSDYTQIEIFRLKFEFSKTPTRSLIKLSVDKDFNPIGESADFRIQPFDMIVVRTIAEFGLQETAELSGAVRRSGSYYLRKKKYHFSDMIKDAGGFLDDADVYNVTLVRYTDNSGLIVFNAEDAMKNKGSLKKDPIIWKGDYLNVPKMSNTIQIEPVGTKYILGENQNVLQITYQGKLSAAKYIRNYAGGFARNAELKSLVVISGNGAVRATKRFLFFKKYPKVHPGDKIRVSLLPPDEVKKKREIKPLDTDKFVSRLLAVFTTLALVSAYLKP
ncbi:MAG: polysaccharide biosynthesis/export family protein [Bacteroidia bacterium]|jgi:protein involved in polysaccharide export with SLBB domain